MTWYQIKLPYACAGIAVDESGIVREAAPIFKWMVGGKLSWIKQWVEKKNGTMITLK